MALLPLMNPASQDDAGSCSTSGSCGTSCGQGLEKVYPSTAVRYGAMRWIGEFNYRPGMVFRCGAKVVIQSDRGIELGEQVSLTCNGCDKSVSRDQIKRYIQNSGPEFYRLGSGRILREATEQDIAEQTHLDEHKHDDIDRAALLAGQYDLDMKIVTVEHLLGGERIVFYFASDVRIDFRLLVKELAKHYRTRIEMRQVGARDEARLIADYEVCGRECCCKNFLKKLRPVNMKMAKLQKSTLDPSKVSGRCGRLRCCLRYEHESYESLNARLPRVGARVETADGPATVIDRQILTQLVLVRADNGRDLTFPVEELRGPSTAPPPEFVKIEDIERAASKADGRRDRRPPGAAPRVAPRSEPPAETSDEDPDLPPPPGPTADDTAADLTAEPGTDRRPSPQGGPPGQQSGPRRDRSRRRNRPRRGDDGQRNGPPRNGPPGPPPAPPAVE